MEQLRFRISNIRFKEFVLGFTSLHLSIILIYLHLFNFYIAEVFNCSILLFDR